MAITTTRYEDTYFGKTYEAAILELDEKLNHLREEMVEAILLNYEEEESGSVYEMTAEEYLALPGDIRL